MKIIKLAALALIGASFGTIPAFAAPLNPGMVNYGIVKIAPDESFGLVQVAKKKSNKKSAKKNNYNSGNNFIPGHVLTPYGYADCRGWWEQHSDGRMECHGVLVRERYWD